MYNLRVRKRAFLFLALTVALAGFILFTSTNSGASHSELGGRTIEWLNQVIFQGTLSDGEKEAIVGVSVKLFGHFSLFLLDGLFFTLFLRELKSKSLQKALILFAFGLVLSILGEVLQLFSNGRNGNVFDVVIDYSGFLLPYAFAYLWANKTPLLRRD